MKKVFQYLKFKHNKWLEKNQKKRRLRFAKKRAKLLKNKDFSLFSNNCNGGVILRERDNKLNLKIKGDTVCTVRRNV